MEIAQETKMYNEKSVCCQDNIWAAKHLPQVEKMDARPPTKQERTIWKKVKEIKKSENVSRSLFCWVFHFRLEDCFGAPGL
jgi:hypothetical protein